MSEAELVKNFFYVIWAETYYQIVISMIIFYIIYLVIKNPGLVDFAWAFNYAIVATDYLIETQNGVQLKPIFVTILVYLWFLRLGGMIMITRIIPGHQDARYENMVTEKTNPYVFFFIQYQFQGVLVMFCVSPLYFCYLYNDLLPWTFYLGACISVFALIFETIADKQLNDYQDRIAKERREAKLKSTNETQSQFQEDGDTKSAELIEKTQESKKGIFNEGLWQKSRHPNLFFELMVWVGFSVIGLGPLNNNYAAFLGFLGPFFLYLIMNFVTVPVTENYMKISRGKEWEEFCQKTNKFWVL